MNFEIKKYEEQDRSSLLLVWERSVLATHHFLAHQDFAAIKNILQQLNFSELNVYCLKNQDTITGFISIVDRKIEMLFLDPGYIGMGLGQKLLQFALNDQAASQVTVNEQNVQAVKFYLKSGFVIHKRTPKDDLGFDYPILEMHLQ